jgi:integrase
MRALREELANYLALRRSMGFKLRRAEKLLDQFVAHCNAIGAESVRIEIALGWASLPEGASTSWICHRLGVVRAFSRYLALVDDRTQVIPTDVVPHRSARATPFLYSEDQVLAMMAAARSLCSPVRQATFETIIGVLWATGMRIGEALRLDIGDVDVAHGVLTVRDSKFGKTRELPLHASTTVALGAYATRRAHWFPPETSDPFFVSAAGTRVLYCNFHLGFQQLVQKAGIAARSRSCRPRPHDLRHTYAVRTLIGWYRDGVDVEANLPKLSTYLGHVVPANTYCISPPRPNCSHSPPSGSKPPRSSHDEPGAHAASLLHRAAHDPTTRQPPHRRRL